MKFRRGFFNILKSDTGISVKDRSISGYVEYREGKRRAVVPINNDFQNKRAYIVKDAMIKWTPPFDSEVIGDEKKQEIINAVYEALRFNGGPIEIV